MPPEARIADLRRALHEHNHRYYVLAEPVISDREFDALLKELEQLEEQHPELQDPNSPTKRVGSGLTDQFDKVAHSSPMLSLSNSYNQDELQDWADRVQRETSGSCRFTCELKYDGVAIALQYHNGGLVRALTRGRWCCGRGHHGQCSDHSDHPHTIVAGCARTGGDPGRNHLAFPGRSRP